MTIFQLMADHGHSFPFSVTKLGEVVAIRPNVTQSFAAPETKLIRPHTFHGGANPKDKKIDTSEFWWNASGALDRDIEEMSRFFPNFKLFHGEGSLPPRWVGVIDTGTGKDTLTFVYRKDGGLPQVIPSMRKTRMEAGRVRISPHLYTNGNLCVAAQTDWKPEEHTMADVVAWAAHWMAVYVSWYLSGEWISEGISDAG
ncbi:hypothetical protein [Mycetocola sp. JXN-3]|uniref:hypothetical protein n=1 Tax=Mycetocola sp. JXN-3 TaxID=2116510 RepID=UPI00165D0288|nr:hypothetical protein [Mycetocola sp. JXN-3]